MIYKVSFEWIQDICKNKQGGFDHEQGIVINTCRNEYNQPKGCSWGKCNEDMCPLLKLEKRL